MIENQLMRLGYSPKESKIYLALVELGAGTISDIAQKTRLPRSTIYSVIGRLEENGMVYQFEQRKVKRYAAQDPRRLLSDLEARKALVKDVLPDLRLLYQAAAVKPAVKYYIGRRELEQMYEEILKRRGLRGYDIISAEGHWLQLDARFFERFKKRRAQAGIRTRMIVERSEQGVRRKRQERATLSDVKVLPPAFSMPFTSGCYIFSESVIFVAYRREHVAVEILSPEITSMMKMLFNFLWRSIGGEIE